MLKYFVTWIVVAQVMSYDMHVAALPNVNQIEFVTCIGEELGVGQSPGDAYAACEAQHDLEVTAKHTVTRHVTRVEVERSSSRDSPPALSMRQDGTREGFVECIDDERAGVSTTEAALIKKFPQSTNVLPGGELAERTRSKPFFVYIVIA